MFKTITTCFILLIALAGLPVHAEILASYEFEDAATSSDTETNSTAGTFAVGAGAPTPFSYSTLGQSGTSAYFSNNGFYQNSAAGAYHNDDYVSVDLSCAAGYAAALSNLSFYARLDAADSEGAPRNYALFTSADNYTRAVAAGALAVTDAFEPYTIALSGVSNLQTVVDVELRLYLWRNVDGSPSTRVFRLDTVVLEGSTFEYQAPEVLAGYGFKDTAASTDTNAQTTAGPFSVGAGASTFSYSALGQPPKSAYFNNAGFSQTTESGAVTFNDYVYFTLFVEADDSASLSELSFYARFDDADSAGAPESYALYSSADGYASAVATGMMVANDGTFELNTIDLSGVSSLQDIGDTEFRLYLWTANGIQGSSERVWRLDELLLTGIVEERNDLPPFRDSFYVSPNGDDGNPGTREAPFAGLERARQAVRDMTVQMTNDITVYFDPGNYPVASTVVFDGHDSGRFGHKVIYRAAGAPGSARILGADPVTGWQSHTGGIWKVSLTPGITPHTLYENGVRARQARFPDHDFDNRFNVASATYLLADNSSDDILYRSGDLPAGEIPGWDLSDAELVISPWEEHDWDLWTLPLVNIDTGTRILEVKKASRSDPDFATQPIYDPSADDSSPGNNSRYFLQGVLDFLDQPGEFHYDSSENTLYYWPHDGVPDDQEILIPQTETIVLLDGSAGAGQVTDLCFDGLRFEAADFTDYYPGPFTDIGYTSGMVRGTGTRRIEFLRCHFRNAGFVALLMHDDNADNLVESCRFERATGGVWFNTTPANNGSANDNHRVLNCLVQEMGRLTHSPGVGLKLMMAENCEIANCHVRDTARWGVSIRARASAYSDNTSVPGGNVVHHSIVERSCQDSGDIGGLHTANVSINMVPYNTNTYRQMIVRDTEAHPSLQDPQKPNGIFTDYESFGQFFEDVWILGTADGAADFRENPVQGVDPPGLTANHTFSNVSWKTGFDTNRMETGSIGLRPDFPAEYLPAGRLLFSEDFNTYTTGDLAGQGGWTLSGGAVASPTVATGISGTDGTPVAGPAAAAPAGVFSADKTVDIGSGSEVPLIIEFDLVQNSSGNIPTFGIGRSTVIPAGVGVQTGSLMIRGENYGTITKAYIASNTLFTVELGTGYRIRSVWSIGADGGNGRASLYVKNLSAAESSFTQLYFDDGVGGLTTTAPLELITAPSLWDRAWLRVGSSTQLTYIDHIAVRLSPPDHATDPFEAWRQANFTPAELADPAISGPEADPLGDGTANVLKFVRGVAPYDPVPEASHLNIFFENGETRVSFVRALDSFGLNSAYKVSYDLFTWEDYLLNFGVYRVEDQGGLRTTVFGPDPGDPVPQKLFVLEQYQVFDSSDD